MDNQKKPLSTMSNGHLCMVLRNDIDWDKLEDFLYKFCANFEFEILDFVKSIDTFVASLKKKDVNIWMGYDDYCGEVALESRTKAGDQLLIDFYNETFDNCFLF